MTGHIITIVAEVDDETFESIANYDEQELGAGFSFSDGHGDSVLLKVREISDPVGKPMYRNFLSPGAGGCSEIQNNWWAEARFSKRCYFYPARDCPGWVFGGKCGRTGYEIPGKSNPA